MMPRLPAPFLHQLFPVAGHRLVVIDPGTRTVKVLVADSTFGRLRILSCQTIDPEEGGSDEAADLRDQLTAVLSELGPHRVALVLPQHRTIASTIDVPHATAAEAERFIESEARKLSGLGEDAMFHGATRLQPLGHLHHPHFVTLCKRDEIRTFIDRYLPAGEEAAEAARGSDLTEVATTGQALFAAMGAAPTAPANAVIVDLGADNTVVAIRVEGQGVHATSFEGGSSQFTATLATENAVSWTAAEARKRTHNVFEGPQASESCARAVEKWYAEVRRAVVEWLDDYPELALTLASLPVFLCGGGAAQPGLAEYLNRLGSLKFHPWPAAPEMAADESMDPYRVAYGAARIALGTAGDTTSLLPPELQRARQHRRGWEILQAANLLLLALIALLLGLATWQKAALLQHKNRLIQQTRTALLSAEAVAQLSRRLEDGYAGIRPVLRRQQQSIETLAAFAAVRQIRTNNDFWFVLFADPSSYGAGTTLPGAASSTNPPASSPATSSLPTRREFIAEICIPQEGDAARRILSQVVTDLKRNPLFGRVDALPPERKRSVVDPRVAISNHVFAVAMEIAPSEVSVTLDSLAPAPAPRDNKRTPPALRSRTAVLSGPDSGTNR